MLQLLPQSDILIPNTFVPDKAIEYINSYIQDVQCEFLNVDISFMNAIDAFYVSTMCSTRHFIKYPDGKINWIVSSIFTEELNGKLSLGNAQYVRM